MLFGAAVAVACRVAIVDVAFVDASCVALRSCVASIVSRVLFVAFAMLRCESEVRDGAMLRR